MERDGQLVFTRRQCYALPERLDLVKGTVIGHRDGYGFLRVEGRKDDLYLSSEQMKTCIHGDQVLAQPLGADRKGRREARIVRVLVPKTSQIVGRYFTEAGVGFVVPDDSRLSFDSCSSPSMCSSTASSSRLAGFSRLVKCSRINSRLGMGFAYFSASRSWKGSCDISVPPLSSLMKIFVTPPAIIYKAVDSLQPNRQACSYPVP